MVSEVTMEMGTVVLVVGLTMMALVAVVVVVAAMG
jgi:hypothetical protein